MDGSMKVAHRGGDRFEITVRQHVVEVDQPVDGGGEDTAPTPTELFVAGLASCVAFYARRYLARHELPTEGLAVRATWSLTTRPARVAAVEIRVAVPPGVPDDRRAALAAVASHCTVHNTLEQPPRVDVALEDQAAQAA